MSPRQVYASLRLNEDEAARVDRILDVQTSRGRSGALRRLLLDMVIEGGPATSNAPRRDALEHLNAPRRDAPEHRFPNQTQTLANTALTTLPKEHHLPVFCSGPQTDPEHPEHQGLTGVPSNGVGTPIAIPPTYPLVPKVVRGTASEGPNEGQRRSPADLVRDLFRLTPAQRFEVLHPIERGCLETVARGLQRKGFTVTPSQLDQLHSAAQKAQALLDSHVEQVRQAKLRAEQEAEARRHGRSVALRRRLGEIDRRLARIPHEDLAELCQRALGIAVDDEHEFDGHDLDEIRKLAVEHFRLPTLSERAPETRKAPLAVRAGALSLPITHAAREGPVHQTGRVIARSLKVIPSPTLKVIPGGRAS